MTSKATAWLLEQRTARNLSLREMARQMGTGITHTTISDAEKGFASPETWKQLAEFFKTPPNLVLSWAGFLDALPSKDELIISIETDLEQMTPAGRQLAARMIHALVDDHKKNR